MKEEFKEIEYKGNILTASSFGRIFQNGVEKSQSYDADECKKIAMFRDDELVEEFPYMELCFTYLRENGYTNASNETIRGNVNSAIRNNRTYKGFTFVKG